jgi:hypothetical protein
MINVAPLPHGLQRYIEEGTGNFHKDVKTLFKQDHLSKLYTHFSRPSLDHQDASSSSSPGASIVSGSDVMTIVSDKDRNDHPSWAALSVALASNSICPRMSGREGFTKTSEAHLRQCSTAIQNLWEGDVYQKSLDYLLRFLLRTYLAPKRDAANRERAARFVAQKKEISERKQVARNSTLRASHWRHSMRKLTDKLTDIVLKNRTETALDIRESREKAIACLWSSIKVLSSKRPSTILITQPIKPIPIDTEVVTETPDEDGSDDLDHILSEVQIQLAELGMDVETDDPASMDTEKGQPLDVPDHGLSSQACVIPGTTPSQEPDRQTLKKLQALTKVLLESPSSRTTYTLDHVRESAFKGSSFSDEELSVVLRITNALRPFVPRRWKGPKDKTHRQHTAHVALRAPIAMISNAVLRLTGHADYTRRIAPHVSCGDLHALLLGPAQLFETLCSSSAGHFDILDHKGQALVSTQDAIQPVENKNMVFQGFLDMDKVEKTCHDHGLTFGQRYVSLIHLFYNRCTHGIITSGG